jgi:hypothetical protein
MATSTNSGLVGRPRIKAQQVKVTLGSARTRTLRRRFLVACSTAAAVLIASGLASTSARAGDNGYPASPGSVSCVYGLPLVSVHMAHVTGLNTTPYPDYQQIGFNVYVREWVNGGWQNQISPTYNTGGGWIPQGNSVLQWFNASTGLQVSPSTDFYTFRLSGSHYIYITYTYGWNDWRTGRFISDSSTIGPIQC